MSSREAVSEWIGQLNPEQRQAVLHAGGPLLVLAGAGTGKTRVITVKIAHLATTGTLPEHILALTFTNKAAGEMGERVAEMLGQDVAGQMTIGTFHSLGLRILEQHADRLGYKRGISLLAAADQTSAVRQCLKQLGIDPRRHDPRGLLTQISNHRNARRSPEAVAAAGDPGSRQLAKVYRAYMEWLAAYQAMDFDDLILRPVELLETFEDVRDHWQSRYRAILVDEYQDTSGMQLALIRLLAEAHRNLCVVGDDDQSIYGWRGATISNILDFEEHFPDATAIPLTQNYRSTGHILNAANHVISHNTGRRVKELWTQDGMGEQVRVVTMKDQAAEASFIAAEIRRRFEGEHRAWHHFGILFRTSAQAAPIEDALRLAGVPYRLVGAYGFFERKEVKDMLSYLRLVQNPHDEVSLLRIINFPQRGIGPRTLIALRDLADARRASVWDILKSPETIAGTNGPQRTKLGQLRAVVLAARRQHRDNPDIAALIAFIAEQTGARAAWIRDPTEGPGGKQRWRHIEQLMESVKKWQARDTNDGTLETWLKAVALDSRSNDADERDEVALLTLHSAKGLEWPICFVVGCQEGLIPHQRTLEDAAGDVSEERRLFYVGITRARRVAFLTLARVRKRFRGTEPARPSRFLREIPAEHRIDEVRATGGGDVDKSEAKRRFQALRERLAASRQTR